MGAPSRRVRVVVALACSVLALGTVGGPTAAVAGSDDDPLRVTVGGLGPATTNPAADLGARARFDRFNEGKQAPGLRVEYLPASDDGGGPTSALAAARALVKDEDVVALVPVRSEHVPGDYLVQQEVAWFGSGVGAGFCAPRPADSSGFGYRGCVAPPRPMPVPDWGRQLHELVAAQTGNPQPTLAIIADDTAAAQQRLAADQVAYAGAGFTVVVARAAPAAVVFSDSRRYAADLLVANGGQNPDAIRCDAGVVGCAALWTQLRANNFRGTFQSDWFSDQLASAFAGAVQSVPFVPLTEQTDAGAQMVADVRAIDAGADITADVVDAYLAADVFLAALTEVWEADGEVAADAIVASARDSTYRVRGLYGPTRYPKSSARATPACSALVGSIGATWVTIDPYECSRTTYD